MAVHYYGLLVAGGVLAAIETSAWLAARRGYQKNLVWNGIYWALVPAIIGARIYHAADLWFDYYRFHPAAVFYIWQGGLGIFGALFGGFFGLYLYWRLKIVPVESREFQLKTGKNLKLKIQFLILLNLISFGLPLAQTIGRLGNYFNQELYGFPTSLPWGIYIEPEKRLARGKSFERFHPLFAYEAVWLLMGFSIMYLSEKDSRDQRGLILKTARKVRRVKSHKVLIGNSIRHNYFAFYLIWYGTGRFFLEFLRPPEFSWIIPISSANFNINLHLAQLLSALMVVFGVIIFLSNRDGRKQKN